MANITAADVNKLRQQTGAGMMDCKNALVEADGDFEKAIEELRKKGQKVAAKRGDRETNEGLVLALSTDDGKTGVLLTVNCETDFVAKNDDFNDFATSIAQLAVNNAPADLEELLALPYNGDGQSVSEKITDEVGKTGEKIELSFYGKVEGEEVIAYNHPGNQMASVIGLSKPGFGDAGKDLAMQVAAMAPVALDKDDVPQDVVDKEIEIGKEQAINEGKPADLAEKIAMGKLNKFYKESTLLNQDFIKDGKKTVAQYLQETDAELKITSFQRQSLV